MNGVTATDFRSRQPPHQDAGARVATAAVGPGVTSAAAIRAATVPASPTQSPIRAAAADFSLDLLFRLAGHAPALTRIARPLLVRGAYRCSRAIRAATAANARRIFGPNVSPSRIEEFGRGVVENFYDFVCDVGQSLHLSREQLLARIDSIEGHDHYTAARAMKKGAIVATAHMGSFEAGAAAIVEHEQAVHVVFKRDRSRFEQVRTALRGKLGVREAPVDEGWTLWLRLRDALMRDEVVMLQADRVIPRQKGTRVPFLHGHLVLPTGPIKLAMASGAPIIPVFALRTPEGKIRIHVEPAIAVDAGDDADALLLRLARVLEKYVEKYPEQWLVFHRAFYDDGGVDQGQVSDA